MNRNTRFLSIAAAIFAALCWGSSTIMSKGALNSFRPSALLVVQLTASVAFIWTILLIRGVKRPSIPEAARFAWLGLLEPGAAYLLGLRGLAATQAGGATLIQSSESIMIVFIAAVLIKERVTKRIMYLSVAAFSGLILALGHPAAGTISPGNLTGDGLIFVGTFVAGIYVVLSSRIAADWDPMLIVGCQQIVALLFALAFLPFEKTSGAMPPPSALPLRIWALALSSGIVQYALAFSFYLFAMRGIGASVAGAFLNLIPVIGLLGAFLCFRETLTSVQLAGIFITIGCLFLISRGDSQSSQSITEAA